MTADTQLRRTRICVLNNTRVFVYGASARLEYCCNVVAFQRDDRRYNVLLGSSPACCHVGLPIILYIAACDGRRRANNMETPVPVLGPESGVVSAFHRRPFQRLSRV